MARKIKVDSEDLPSFEGNAENLHTRKNGLCFLYDSPKWDESFSRSAGHDSLSTKRRQVERRANRRRNLDK